MSTLPNGETASTRIQVAAGATIVTVEFENGELPTARALLERAGITLGAGQRLVVNGVPQEDLDDEVPAEDAMGRPSRAGVIGNKQAGR